MRGCPKLKTEHYSVGGRRPGFGDLSCYGAQRVATPAIDSLAANGVQLTNMHACASTSTPSRYGMLTGEYPFRRRGTNVAAGDAGTIIQPEQNTVANLMHRAGYATAAIGKWHLGLGSQTGKQNWNGELDITPANLGFDYHYIMAATADRVPCVYIENGRVADYDPKAPISVSYIKNFEGEPTGKANPELLTKLHPSHGHNQSIVNWYFAHRIYEGRRTGTLARRGYCRQHPVARRALYRLAPSQSFLYVSLYERCACARMPHERFRGKSVMGLRGEAILQFDWT